MLKQRILTALVIIPLIFAVIYWIHPVYFPWAVGILVSIAAWEWTGLSAFKHGLSRLLYIVGLWILFLLIGEIPVNFNCSVPAPGCIFVDQIAVVGGIGAAWWLFAVVWLLRYQRHTKEIRIVRFPFALIGVVILIPFWFSLFILYLEQTYQFVLSDQYGLPRPQILLFLISIIALADTSAYFVGKKWGKRKLASRISPGKTWEGLIGAFIIVGLFTPLLAAVMNIDKFPLWKLAILVFITIIAALLGDLFESLVKRLAGVKDSGKILPGHGGILDRIDSYTAAVPIFMMGYFLL